MASAFLQGAGVDPARMKVFMLTLVFAVIFVVAAWIGRQILEAYMGGELEKTQVIQSCVMLGVTVFGVLSFIAWF